MWWTIITYFHRNVLLESAWLIVSMSVASVGERNKIACQSRGRRTGWSSANRRQTRTETDCTSKMIRSYLFMLLALKPLMCILGRAISIYSKNKSLLRLILPHSKTVSNGVWLHFCTRSIDTWRSIKYWWSDNNNIRIKSIWLVVSVSFLL